MEAAHSNFQKKKKANDKAKLQMQPSIKVAGDYEAELYANLKLVLSIMFNNFCWFLCLINILCVIHFWANLYKHPSKVHNIVVVCAIEVGTAN